MENKFYIVIISRKYIDFVIKSEKEINLSE